MTSPDIVSLFTNIPLDENIYICIDSLYNVNENTSKISIDIFRNFLNVATKKSFFMFNNKLYLMVWLRGLYWVQL